MKVAHELDRKQRKHSEVTVYKPKGQAVYYYRVMVHGRRFNRSTGHVDKARAVAQAKILALELRAGGDARGLMKRPGYATCGQMADVWLRESGAATAGDNVAVLRRWIASWTGGDWRAVSTQDLTVARLETWLRNYSGSTVGRRTTLATLRALWQPKALRWYAREGLTLPDFAGLRGVTVPDSGQRGKRFEGFRLIDADSLMRMDAAAEVLRRSGSLEDRRLWAVYALMRWCGLRNSEVAAVRWGWFVRGRRGPVLELVARVLADGSRWEPKGRSGTVPIRRRLLALLRRGLVERAAGTGRRRPGLGDFVIPRAHGTDAAQLVERRINEFVRPFLPDRQKGAYELRKQFGAEIAVRDGLEVASRLLRHGAITTTWAHYHALVHEPAPL
jgi:hypothetical protein